MDKAVILGVFDFISFHVCKSLLNRGIEVNGVDFEDIGNSAFLDEKRLEVGRNANFIEQPFSRWEIGPREASEKQTLIFSGYDLFMLYKEQILLNGTVGLQICKQINASNANWDCVIILPIQMLDLEKENELSRFVEKLKELLKELQIFYLPSIYGPWQPQTFLFQQAIISSFERIEIARSEREWTGDVLFVEDAVELILEKMESGNPGTYLLESGEKDYWAACAEFLKIDQRFSASKHCAVIPKEQQLTKIQAKKITPFPEAVKKQMEHVEQLLGNKR